MYFTSYSSNCSKIFVKLKWKVLMRIFYSKFVAARNFIEIKLNMVIFSLLVSGQLIIFPPLLNLQLQFLVVFFIFVMMPKQETLQNKTTSNDAPNVCLVLFINILSGFNSGGECKWHNHQKLSESSGVQMLFTFFVPLLIYFQIEHILL